MHHLVELDRASRVKEMPVLPLFLDGVRANA